MEIYNELLSYTRYGMRRYNIPCPLHNPEEFVNEAFIKNGFEDIEQLKRTINTYLIHTHAKLCEAIINRPFQKKCNQCKEDKSSSTNFRLRFKNGGLGEKHWFINHICLVCEKNNAYSYYESKKHNPEFKLSNVLRVRKYYQNNTAVLLERSKGYRKKPSAKANRKKYNEEHRETIRQQHRENQRRWAEELTDGYVKGKIAAQLKISARIVTPEMIIQKRIEILKVRENGKQSLHSNHKEE